MRTLILTVIMIVSLVAVAGGLVVATMGWGAFRRGPR